MRHGIKLKANRNQKAVEGQARRQLFLSVFPTPPPASPLKHLCTTPGASVVASDSANTSLVKGRNAADATILLISTYATMR